MFGWEVDAYSRFWRWNLIKICVWTCDMNSTLGSVVPLAMFFLYILFIRLLHIFIHLLFWKYISHQLSISRPPSSSSLPHLTGRGILLSKRVWRNIFKFWENHSTSVFSKICFHNRTSSNSRINQNALWHAHHPHVKYWGKWQKSSVVPTARQGKWHQGLNSDLWRSPIQDILIFTQLSFPNIRPDDCNTTASGGIYTCW